MIDAENFTELPFVHTHDRFTVFFCGDHIFIEGKEYPVGQCCVDVLNWTESFLLYINRRMLDFYYAAKRLLNEDTDRQPAPHRRRYVPHGNIYRRYRSIGIWR
jgi:hypothetical protein